MNAKYLFSAIILVFLINSAFSATCYRAESYCSTYDEIEFNCRQENYNPYTCQLYGPHSVYVSKTCTRQECSNNNVCNWEYEWRCKTRTVYDTCYKTCRRTIYKDCCRGSFTDPICGRHSSCGFSHYEYYNCNPYNCNPKKEDYDCRWIEVQKCKNEEVCTNVNYDCSTYETKTGWYSGTCYNTRTICDKATNYDKCLIWSDKEVPYECSNMKLESYNLSINTIKLGDKILAMFNLTDCSGAVNYEFYMKNFNAKGTANCGLNLIYIEPNTAGTQILLLILKDSSASITKNLGTILVTNLNGQIDSGNPFIASAFMNDLESGKFDEKIMEWIDQRLNNEEIIKNLMLTFGAVGLVITTNNAKKIRDYLNALRLAYFIQPFIMIKDFIKGFLFGSNQDSNQAELAGEFIGGFFLIGDFRDVIISILSYLGLNDREFDPTLLALSTFGLFLDFADVSAINNGFILSLKTIWKRLPKAVRSNVDDFFRLIKNSDEMGQVYKLLIKLPVEKLGLFFNSAHELLKKTPLKHLEDLISLFLRLIKYGDDLTISFFKKCSEWQDAAKITKYFDDFGEQAFEQLIKNHSFDEAYEIMMRNADELIEITQINTKLIQSNLDEINKAILDLSKFDEGFQGYISEIKITQENSKYFGCFDGKNIELAFGNGLSDAQAYEIMIHEGGHAIIKNSNSLTLNIKGYENLQVHDAIDKYFDDSLSFLEKKYDSLYNQMQDVATNKLALTNPNLDKNKWYNGFKEDYKDIIEVLNKNNKEIFNFISNNDDILPKLVEIKIVFENNNELELIKKIDKVLESIKYSENSFIYDDFNMIYNSYKNVFEAIK